MADFIAEQKKLGHTLSYSIDASMSDIVAEWYWDNSELFALAWLNGYEVEKEKRYFVKIKGNIKENMLVYGELLKRYFFTKSFSLDDVIYSHTRKQLEEAGLGWVFDCEGIEIEEVE
ncbi:phage protein [Streptococcus pneumoniae]|nr:phage protein [Streptococcus pneumoniae]